jgi:hypothetical protein
MYNGNSIDILQLCQWRGEEQGVALWMCCVPRPSKGASNPRLWSTRGLRARQILYLEIMTGMTVNKPCDHVEYMIGPMALVDLRPWLARRALFSYYMCCVSDWTRFSSGESSVRCGFQIAGRGARIAGYTRLRPPRLIRR